MRKKILAMLLALVLAVGLLPATAFAADEEFLISEEGVLNRYNGPGGDVIIPKNVTSIGYNAFSFCTSLTSVLIPEGVTSIEDGAFEGCTSLTSVLIPEGVTSIGDNAFWNCTSLTSVTIPNSVTSIGDAAFSRCESLTSVTIPDSVTSIGVYAFWNCTSLTSVTIPDSVTSIGVYAFWNCTSLTSVTIPNSVTTIDEKAFYACNSLTSVTIPDSVTSIGDAAFSACNSLTSINVVSGNSAYISVDDVLFNADQTLLLTYPAGKNDLSYNIPDSVTSIGDSAFIRCHSLTSVTIPDSVTSISDYAFAWCESLTSVTIPDGVTSIGDNAFAGCESLTSVTIPDSVTFIGDGAFYFCTSLTSVVIPEGVTSIGESAFGNCSSLTSVTIPDSVTTIDDEAFYGCENLTNVYYSGSEEQWGQILCNGLTHDLAATPWQLAFSDGGQAAAGFSVNATIHYNSTGPEPAEPEPETPAITFSDVAEDAWYKDTVSAAVERGLIEGVGDGRFAPGSNMTRGSFLVILSRIEDPDIEKGSSPWYQKSVDWAKDNDISDGNNPGGDISREQLVVMLWRYAGKPGADASVLDKFSDSSNIHNWAGFREAMAWAVESGILEGDGGKLRPLGVADRAQAVTIVMRYCDKFDK